MAANALDFGTIDIGFSPIDLFNSAVSLSKPFLPFLLLGLSFIIVPWLYKIIVNAIKTARSKAA